MPDSPTIPAAAVEAGEAALRSSAGLSPYYAAQSIIAAAIPHLAPDNYDRQTGPNGSLRVYGVSRMWDNPQAMLISMSDVPTDDQLRDLHEFLKGWQP